jgi:predicted AlkP superfamily pyrophosphatase or phosphodiesterase
MSSTSKDKLIYLDTLINLNEIEYMDCWPLKGLRPFSNENITSIYNHLNLLSQNQPWKVYLRDINMPSKWHFSSSYRIAPIFLVPDEGWVILNSKEEFDPEEDKEYYPRGLHGYDNDEVNMRSLFIGVGPQFERVDVAPFENVEVYGIMARILGVKENPNNGTFVKGKVEPLR